LTNGLESKLNPKSSIKNSKSRDWSSRKYSNLRKKHKPYCMKSFDWQDLVLYLTHGTGRSAAALS
jgi:hypothetical protein